jgi:tRNA 5-methylaminomethyl-2-thiouridine biosynthesis bifunctional protein
MPTAHRVAALLGPAGFTLAAGAATAIWRGQFAPRWQVKSSRYVAPQPAQRARTALVIGAGLAGAATAAALAHRGWQVRVLGSHTRLGSNAANGSSTDALDLPLGLFCPHLSKNDAPLSRLVGAGISLLAQRLPTLLVHGRDWAMLGTMQTLFAQSGPTTSLSQLVSRADPGGPVGQVWHAQAGWVKPQALIRALLATPGVETNTPAQVGQLRFQAGMWQALDAQGGLLAQARLAVLTTAGGTAGLLSGLRPAHRSELSDKSRLASLHPVHGQISWGYQSAADALVLPRHPVNGHGHLSAQIPAQQRRAWYAGATYEAESAAFDDAALIANGHRQNFQRLQTLAPELARHLAERFAKGNLESWRGTRFATRDRLPLVGPWLNTPETGLWVNTGLGSRGLSWCLLTAELLAARLHGEPLPIDAQLAGKLAL